jgi:hypothetical protein
MLEENYAAIVKGIMQEKPSKEPRNNIIMWIE